MKKLLIVISILNLVYVYLAGVVEDTNNWFLVSFGVPVLTTFILLTLGIISLIFDENGTNKRTLSIIIIGINLLPLFVVASMFIFI
ncbi:hypothetical protein [Salinicoccus siamensis]|uniref:Uncharacterized protein n=1 Tax=Salinicoccus siamensis TaxID=381830 RepID=A0ABV5Z7N8_9STAP